jgi:hypothetical protein
MLNQGRAFSQKFTLMIEYVCNEVDLDCINCNDCDVYIQSQRFINSLKRESLLKSVYKVLFAAKIYFLHKNTTFLHYKRQFNVV